jgi:hypothetical protein
MDRHRQANRLQPERLIPKALSMPKHPTTQPSIALTARFVAVLYAATQGRSGRWRRIGDCAERAGIKGADVERAVRIFVSFSHSVLRTSPEPPQVAHLYR